METEERVTRLEEKLVALTADVGEIKSGMTVQTRMLTTLTSAEERRKGALAALTRVGAIFGSGGLVGAIVNYFLHKP